MDECPTAVIEHNKLISENLTQKLVFAGPMPTHLSNLDAGPLKRRPPWILDHGTTPLSQLNGVWKGKRRHTHAKQKARASLLLHFG